MGRNSIRPESNAFGGRDSSFLAECFQWAKARKLGRILERRRGISLRSCSREERTVSFPQCLFPREEI